jgi:LysR family transcriptional activator of nhaA
MQVYSHLLGRSPVGLFATRTLLERHECVGLDVQTCLEKVPLLLSTSHANLRMSFDSYCSQEGIEPKVVAEFQDSAQIKVYGQYEWGAFLAPICIASDICAQYNFELIGELPFDTGFFAITTEKEIRDTVVMNVIEQSRAWFTEQAAGSATSS